MPITVTLSDDQSLKNGFFVLLNGHPNSGGANLYAEQITSEGTSITLSRTIDISSISPGQAEIYLIVIDASGNESNYNTYATIYANEWWVPTINVVSPHEGQILTEANTSFSPSITVKEYDSSSITCKYYIDSKTTVKDTKIVTNSNPGSPISVSFSSFDASTLTPGNHTIIFDATDGTNTHTMSVNITINITAPPTPVLTPNITYPTNEDVTVTISNWGSAAAKQYRIDNGIWQSYTGPITMTSNGRVEARGLTASGLSSSIGSLQINNIDKTPPTTPILASDINNPTNGNITVSISNWGDAITKQYRVNSGSWMNYSNPITVSDNCTIEAQGIDTAGNMSIIGILSINNIDKIVPTIVQTSYVAEDTSISISGAASDSSSGLNALPYRYSVGSYVSQWMTDTTHIVTDLIPDTNYSAKIEARDVAGNICEYVFINGLITKAQIPTISYTDIAQNSIAISFSDLNPSSTEYQLMVNGQYVNSLGELTDDATWITIPDKSIVINSLQANTEYTIHAKARNMEGIVTDSSQAVVASTLPPLPDMPINLISEATENSVSLTWDPVIGADSYDIEADGQLYNILSTNFIHTDLAVGTEHTYRVRSRNISGTSNWSSTINVSTRVPIPQTPVNITLNSLETTITLKWDAVQYATGYQIEVDGTIVYNGDITEYTHKGLIPHTQHNYRVKAMGMYGDSEWSELFTKETLPITYTENLIPVMTANNAPEGLASASSVYGSYYEWKAFDRVNTELYNGWACKKGTAASWLQYAFNTATVVRKYTLIGQKGYQARSPKSWTFEGSSNGTDWTVLDTRTNVTGWTDLVKKEFEFTNNTAYKYYRINITENNGDATYIVIAEMEMMGSTQQPTEAPSVPTNLKTVPTADSITFIWDAAANATSYDVEADGIVIENVMDVTYLHTGLDPQTQHTYRVRAKNALGISGWSEAITGETLVQYTENLIPVMTANNAPEGLASASSVYGSYYEWKAFDRVNTELYNGWACKKGTAASWLQYAFNTATVVRKYTLIGQKGYQARSPKSWTFEGSSNGTDWTVLDTRTNVTGWTDLVKKEFEFTNNTAYKYYRINITENNGDATYIVIAEMEMMGVVNNTIEVPANFKAVATDTTVSLSWDAAFNADEYEIEVNGVIIVCGANLQYLHEGLTPSTQYIYRVRGKKGTKTSEWSEPLVISTAQSAYQASCITAQQFNFLVSSENITDFSQITYTITYNSDELELIDICASTYEKELNAGFIAGADIEILEVQPGTIVFKVTKAIEAGMSWSGTVNSIRFKSKIDGESIITYSIQ
ncbi:MAG: discoidin domain-containing protein [Bacillota bacterium]